MKVFVDRIENGIAVLLGEDATTVDIPLSWLPFDVQEGVYLDISIDNESTRKAHDEVQSLLDSMPNNP